MTEEERKEKLKKKNADYYRTAKGKERRDAAGLLEDNASFLRAAADYIDGLLCAS